MQRHQEQTGFSSLTEKELEVFRLLALGHAVKHVAMELPIATATAHVHRRNILTKLELNSNFDLTKLAFSLGLITPEDLYC
jgi:DNA-binding NarL/FixJ family response regulator